MPLFLSQSNFSLFFQNQTMYKYGNQNGVRSFENTVTPEGSEEFRMGELP